MIHITVWAVHTQPSHLRTQSDPEKWWLNKSLIKSQEDRRGATHTFWRIGTVLLVIGTVVLLIGLGVRVYGENKYDHADTDVEAEDAFKLARTATDVYMSGIIFMLVGLALIAWFPASTRRQSR